MFPARELNCNFQKINSEAFRTASCQLANTLEGVRDLPSAANSATLSRWTSSSQMQNASAFFEASG